MNDNEFPTPEARIPTLAEDIIAEFGHLAVSNSIYLVDTSWTLHVERQRPLTTHFFSAQA